MATTEFPRVSRKPGLQRFACSLLPALLLATSLLHAQDDEDFFVFEEDQQVSTIADPLEGLNRASFAFNDRLYRALLKPVARVLRIIPSPLRTGAHNFFVNLGAPISAISALLQGDPRNAGTELSRFVINTTTGIVGVFDVATELGIQQDEEDLGQTLARYGIGHGFYLVVPFYGSTSLRDLVGNTATTALNPVYENLDAEDIVAINLVDAEVSLSLDQDTYEAFYDSALDPYVFFRSAWQQNREGKVNQ